jgi:hypothetical protein
MSLHKGTSLVKTLYDLGTINDTELDEALRQVVFNEARLAVKNMDRSNFPYDVYADHVICFPEHLAYAIKEKGLNRRELRVIKKHLDHEKTLDEFVENHSSERVISSLKESILNPKPFEFSSEGGANIEEYANFDCH